MCYVPPKKYCGECGGEIPTPYNADRKFCKPCGYARNLRSNR